MVKQLLTKLVLLVAVVLMGAGTAWADDVKFTVTISSFTDLPSGSASYNTYAWSSGGVNGKATIYANSNSTSMQFNATNYLFYSTSAVPGTIKSIKLTTASGTNRTYVVYGSTSAYSGSGTSYGTQIGSQTVTTSGTTFTVSSGSYTYFTIVKSGSGAGYLSSIEVTYTPSSDPSLTASDLALTGAPIALSFDLYNNYTAQTVSYTTSSTGEVTVANSDYASFSVDQTNKTITVTPTAVTPSTQTITVNQASDATYNGGSVSFTVSVTNSDPTVPGSLGTPYTVAQANANTPSSGNVYIKGIVSAFYGTSIVGDGANYRYYISDDGTTTSQLLVYKGKGLNEVAFSSADDLLIGDEVVICGSLITFSNAPEVAENNYIVSLTRPASITVAKTTINVAAKGSTDEVGITTYGIDASTGLDIEYYLADGTTTTTASTYSWLTAGINSSNKLEYIVDENEGDARSAYLKVYGLDSNSDLVYSDLITITQAKYVIDYASLPFAFNGGKSDISTTVGLTQSGLGSDYASSNAPTTKLKFDGTGDYVVLKINENPGILSFDIKGNSFSQGTFKVQTSVNGTDYADLNSYTSLGDAQTDSYVLPSNVRYIKWIYTNKSNGNVGLGNISLLKEAKVTSNGWATYITPCKVQFEEGNAYIVTAASVSDGLTLAEVTKVDADEPILLKGEGTKTITILPKATEIAANGNLLIVSNGTFADGEYPYVLAKEGAGAAFKQWTGEASVLNGRVVLVLDEAQAARSIFMLDDETTGISTIDNSSLTIDDSVFDLQGRRVAQPTKGLYIVNGKKVVLK